MTARRLRQVNDRGLFLFVAVSIAAHIGVFAFSRMTRSEARVVTPVYNVKLVAANPGGRRANEASAKGDPEAKAPPVAEKKAAPAPAPKVEPVVEKKPAPQPKAAATKPVPKEVAKKSSETKKAVEPRVEKAAAKSEPTPKKAADAKGESKEKQADLGSALSDIKSLLKNKRGHEAGVEGGRSTMVGEFGNGGGGAQAGALALQIYVGQVQSAIQSHWTIPGEMARLRIAVQLGLKVGADGSVIDVWVDKGSGNGIFDNSAMRAVRAASPLPVPPQTQNGYFEFYTRFTPDGARSN